LKERIPPQDLTAERSVLGSQIIDNSKVNVVRDIIEPTDFYSDVHQAIQTAILKTHDAHDGNIDLILLVDTLASMGKLEDIGGHNYLLECLEAVPYSAHASFHAGIVASRSRRRKAIAIGEALINDASDMGKDDNEIIQVAHTAAQKMAECLKVKKSAPKLLSDGVHAVIETYRVGESPTMFWGIPSIDEMIGGTMPGELVIIGARPSVGKSLVGLQWLDHASRKGIPGLLISEEMPMKSVASRHLVSVTSIPESQWRESVDEIQKKASIHFRDAAPILVAENCGSIGNAEREIERAVQSHGIQIVVADYAQIISGSGQTKEQQVSDVSNRLKACAMKHNLVIILLAQLNRKIESRDNQTPMLSDLKDSGGLEADGDVVLLLMWPWKVDSSYDDKTEYRIFQAKNRSRGIKDNVIQLRIDPENQRLHPWSEQGSLFDNIDSQFN